MSGDREVLSFENTGMRTFVGHGFFVVVVATSVDTKLLFCRSSQHIFLLEVVVKHAYN